MIVRKSEDHPGKEAGQIKGNSRSRTETGIEVVGDKIYLFCQGGKNFQTNSLRVPSAVLRISGSNIQSGKPVDIDSDYYVDLNDKTGDRYCGDVTIWVTTSSACNSSPTPEWMGTRKAHTRHSASST